MRWGRRKISTESPEHGQGRGCGVPRQGPKGLLGQTRFISFSIPDEPLFGSTCWRARTWAPSFPTSQSRRASRAFRSRWTFTIRRCICRVLPHSESSQGIFGERPEFVVAGPNAGGNLGPLTLHSGSVRAVATAATNSVPGIALSTQKRACFRFGSVAEFCARRPGKLLGFMGEDCALNINVPALPLNQIAGIRLTRFAPRSLYTTVHAGDGNDPSPPRAIGRCLCHWNITTTARCTSSGAPPAVNRMTRTPARISMDTFQSPSFMAGCDTSTVGSRTRHGKGSDR